MNVEQKAEATVRNCLITRRRSGKLTMKRYPGSGTGDAHFTGQEWDVETATTNFQYRQYSATQGRWRSPDPYDGSYNLFNPQSFNRYAYVLNQPLASIDPDGLDSCWNGEWFGETAHTVYASDRRNCSDGGATFGPPTRPRQPVTEPTPPPAKTDGPAPQALNKPGVPSCSSQNLATRTLSRSAAFANRGLFVGGSFAGSFKVVGAGRTVGLYADPQGNVFRAFTRTFTAAVGTSASGGFTIGVSNYRNGGFAGYSDEVSASAGELVSASGAWSWNADGSGVTLTLGLGYGASVSGGRSGSNTELTAVCHVGG